MAVAAFVGYWLLLVAAFGVRTVLHAGRTGTTGWRAPPTGAAWAGDGLFTLGATGVAAGPVLHLVGVAGRLDALDRVAVGVAGAALLAGGTVTALLAQAHMGTAWRAGIDLSADNDLVADGLFRVVRNPFYTGMLVASAGVALMAPHVASVAGWVLMVAGCQIDVRLVEEPHLRAMHGRAYCAYERAVPRFVPTLSSLSPGGRAPGARRGGR